MVDWTEDQIDDPAYLEWLEAEWNRITDEAVAQRRQEAAMAAEVEPIPSGDEPPF